MKPTGGPGSSLSAIKLATGTAVSIGGGVVVETRAVGR